MTSAKHPGPKICPRCGAFYQTLSSQTCPQCFGYLNLLSLEEAQAYIAEQEARATDPVRREAKEEDDERYRQQAFGGCATVVGIAVSTLVIAVILVAVARHRNVSAHHAAPLAISSPPAQRWTIPVIVDGAKELTSSTVGDLPDSHVNVDVAQYARGIIIIAVPKSPLTPEEHGVIDLIVKSVISQRPPPVERSDLDVNNVHYAVLAPTFAVVDKVALDLSTKER